LNPHPILEDLLGQVSEAIASQQAWGKWGGHYLRSLLCAHRSMQCNNFKDPGVLAYGSAHSRAKRDELDAMCNSLPVPTPSLIPRGYAFGQPATGIAVSAVSATAFRDAFNNADGGCFGTGTQVLMASSQYQAIESICKGDRVRTCEGQLATVVCVIKYSGVKTVRLPSTGLVITPWHPVKLTADGPWQFPADILAEQQMEMQRKGVTPLANVWESVDSCVYNMVLDSGHVVCVDEVQAVTLGHGLVENEVVAHPYWGTDKVIEDLKAHPGFQGGFIDLERLDRKINPATGSLVSRSLFLSSACQV